MNHWSRLLGPSHVIHLESPDETSECIATTIDRVERSLAGGEPFDPPTMQSRKRGMIGRIADVLAGSARVV